MMTICLDKLQFYAFHGIHEEERAIGNAYEMNIAVSLDTPEPVTSLDQTVDYAALYKLASTRMQESTPLLETLVQDLARLIHEANPAIKSLAIELRKKHSPITAIDGSVGVVYKKEY